MTIYVQDTFNRSTTAGSTTISNAAGWGTSSDGSTWASAGGTMTWSIGNPSSISSGKATGTASNTYTTLSATAWADVEVLVRMQSNANNASNFIGLVARYTDTNNHYYCYLTTNGASGAVTIKKRVTGTATQLVTSTQTINNNTWYWLRFRVKGTTLEAKVWADGAAEPAAWTVTTTDSALSLAGNVGMYLSMNASATNAYYNSFQANDTVTSRPISARFLQATAQRLSLASRYINRASFLGRQGKARFHLALAQDTYVRANQTNWGTASDGSSVWTQNGSSTWAISSNTGTVTGSTSFAMGTFATVYGDVDVLTVVSATSASKSFGVVVRAQHSGSGQNQYRIRFDGSGNFLIMRNVSGTATILATTAFTITANTTYFIRVRAKGSTITAKAWAVGTPEPLNYQLYATDTNYATGIVGVMNQGGTTSDTVSSSLFAVTDVEQLTAQYNLPVRLSLSANQSLKASARFILNVASGKIVATRLRLSSAKKLFTRGRLLLLAMKAVPAPSRLKLLGTRSLSIPSRMRQLALQSRSFSTRTRMLSTRNESLQSRFKQTGGPSLVAASRLRHLATKTMAMASRFKQAVTRNLIAPIRLRLLARSAVSVGGRLSMLSLAAKKAVGRLPLQSLKKLPIPSRLVLALQGSKLAFAVRMVLAVAGRVANVRLRLAGGRGNVAALRLLHAARALSLIRGRLMLMSARLLQATGRAKLCQPVLARFASRVRLLQPTYRSISQRVRLLSTVSDVARARARISALTRYVASGRMRLNAARALSVWGRLGSCLIGVRSLRAILRQRATRSSTIQARLPLQSLRALRLPVRVRIIHGSLLSWRGRYRQAARQTRRFLSSRLVLLVPHPKKIGMPARQNLAIGRLPAALSRLCLVGLPEVAISLPVQPDFRVHNAPPQFPSLSTGDTLPLLVVALPTLDLSARDPLDFSLRLINRATGQAVYGRGQFGIRAASPGVVSYAWATQDTQTPGNYFAYIIINYDDVQGITTLQPFRVTIVA